MGSSTGGGIWISGPGESGGSLVGGGAVERVGDTDGDGEDGSGCLVGDGVRDGDGEAADRDGDGLLVRGRARSARDVDGRTIVGSPASGVSVLAGDDATAGGTMRGSPLPNRPGSECPTSSATTAVGAPHAAASAARDMRRR